VNEASLLRGSRSSASEWGHVPIRPGGKTCRCGRRGCIEAYIGADAILDAWREGGADVTGSGWEAMTALLDAAARGEAPAQAVVDDVVLVLGAGLGGLVNLHNPERVVLGGWVGMLLMTHYADRIASSMIEHSLRRPGSQVTLVPAAFGGDSVALGAAILALEALIHGT
jgi:predicted NBD/HSP70 family sugar kinase